ncbi:MAG TPA: type II toxin-antitoxin system VapC family toxin [Thermoanaerobaculia bacterium]
MSRLVIDASAAAEYLLRTPLGQKLQDLVAEASLLAPALLDAEVLAVLRRGLLQKKLEEHRARLVLEDLADWPVDRIPHSILLKEAWKHRHNVSAYDALYVAAAKLYNVPLLTADGPLSRAPGLGIVVQNIRLS